MTDLNRNFLILNVKLITPLYEKSPNPGKMDYIDIIMLWSETNKRIITGSDILGRLLRQVVKRFPA
jgi:hypothetical protein